PAKPAPSRPAPPPPVAPARPAAAAPARVAPPPPRAPEPAPSMQDDIDAMFDKVEVKSNGAAQPSSHDVLDLTEAMEAPEPAPALRRIDGSSDVVYNEAHAAPEPAVMPTVQEARRQFQQQTGADRNLLSASTTAAVDSAFNSLAETV